MLSFTRLFPPGTLSFCTSFQTSLEHEKIVYALHNWKLVLNILILWSFLYVLKRGVEWKEALGIHSFQSWNMLFPLSTCSHIYLYFSLWKIFLPGYTSHKIWAGDWSISTTFLEIYLAALKLPWWIKITLCCWMLIFPDWVLIAYFL